ncbi:MAG: response regulator transcription factor [Limnobacter sp.]|nr:response regulator transcription factor [Limnobacter sp.]
MSPSSAKHSPPVQVILIEDDPATQDRLANLIRSSSALQLMGTASNAQEGYALLFMSNPHVVLVDLGLPDSSGIDIIRWVSQNKPQVETLVITAFGDEYHVIRSLEAGASGYLLKDYSAEEIAEHIVELHAGGSPISPMIARQLLTRIQTEKQNATPPPQLAIQPTTQSTTPQANQPTHKSEVTLTDRELMVIRQVAKGFNTQEIGVQLGISSHTVATHVKRIYRKLQVSNRAEAVFEASASGLLGED